MGFEYIVEEEGEKTRKPRFLCLHGFRTSGEIMKKQVNKWPQSVLQKLDLVFVDAPIPAQGKSDVEGYFDPPYYEWFDFYKESITADNFEDCFEYIQDCMIKHAPIDGLLGFSQGAILSSALAGLQSKGLALTKVPKIKFLVIIGGAKLKAEPWAEKAYASPIECPSLHFLALMKNIKGKGVFSAPGDYIYFKSQVPLHKIPVGLKQWRYYDFGPKEVPPLICIPGTAGSADVYYKQVMALSMKGYRVISVDIPCVWNHDEWIYAFEKFLDVIDVHHIHIYGTSLGGFLAQLFAQHRPRRVKSLVLSNTYLNTKTFAANMPWAPVVSWAPSFLLKRYVLTGIRDGPHEPFIADSVDFVVAQVEALSKDDLASRLTLMVDSASVSPLMLPDASITIMDTNDYCAVPQQLKDEVSERYTGARRAYLKSGGDFPCLSRPDEINLHLQLHLRRVGIEPRLDLVRGAPKPTSAGNPQEEKKREFDDHRSESAGGSSKDASSSQQSYDDNDDHPQIEVEREVKDLLTADKGSCKGPLGSNEREDKDDPHGDDGGHSRGPAKGKEAENMNALHQDEAESSEESSKTNESKNSSDAPKDLERSLISFIFDDLKPSCSNEQWPGNHAAHLLNQDRQKFSDVQIFSEFTLVLLSYVLPAYMGVLYITCVYSCRCR